MHWFAAVFATLAMMVCFTSSASAQSDPHSPKADAEAHYQTAVRLFGEGRYRESLDEFDAAIELSPESIFFCNRAIVLIQLTEIESALESLEVCQNTFEGSEAELAEIDAQRAAVESVVRVVRPRSLTTISDMSAPAEVIVTADADGWTRASTGYVFLAAGGALLASAGTLDLLSADVRTDLEEEASAPAGSTDESYAAARQAYVNRQRIWLGLVGGGGVFALTGAALVLSHFLADDGEEETIAVVPAVNRSGMQLLLRLSW